MGRLGSGSKTVHRGKWRFFALSSLTLLVLGFPGSAVADPGVGTVTVASEQSIFEDEFEKYLAEDAHSSVGTVFQIDEAREQGASEDIIKAGQTFNAMEEQYGDAQEGQSSTQKISLPIWGNWCGPGYGGGKAKDLLDRACMNHDKCYASKGYFNCSCDRTLISSINRDYNRMHATEKIAATAVKAYFNAQVRVNC